MKWLQSKYTKINSVLLYQQYKKIVIKNVSIRNSNLDSMPGYTVLVVA